jgi:predicted helicase
LIRRLARICDADADHSLGCRAAKPPKHRAICFHPGLILTDTLQSWEDDDRLDSEVFRENNERLERLKRLPITVIVGNPPYSVGQESANDDNANEAYPTLDQAIRQTYGARAAKSSIRGLYDSYVRAVKWATLRIRDRGVIAYVTNGGFLDSASADGMRKALADEFSAIHIFNLRGNRRNAGAEGRPIFEAYAKSTGGSIAGITIVLLVKNPESAGERRIHYAQVGDFTTARQKLQELVDTGSILRTDSRLIVPNEQGDWLRQRTGNFAAFLPLWDKDADSIFAVSSKGLTTNRDAWVYNFSQGTLAANVKRMIGAYTSARRKDAPTRDPGQISWSRRLLAKLAQGQELTHDQSAYRLATYRPFQRQYVYFSADLNEDRRRLPVAFPAKTLMDRGFLVTGVGSHYDFAVIATDALPDLHLLDTGHFFPRWTYERAQDEGTLNLALEQGETVDGYRRVDNITDYALGLFRETYGDHLTKDDVFDYCYGMLHSPEYRETYAADLKKVLPRLPLVSNAQAFIEAGRGLFNLHTNYEAAALYPLIGSDIVSAGDPFDFFRVEKLAFAKIRVDGKLVSDRSTVKYNSRITLTGIPEEAHRYRLGPRSAVEWVIDRYQVKVDSASGIINNPNDWSRGVDNPRYVVDLLARVVTISVETVKIVDALPTLSVDAGN